MLKISSKRWRALVQAIHGELVQAYICSNRAWVQDENENHIDQLNVHMARIHQLVLEADREIECA